MQADTGFETVTAHNEWNRECLNDVTGDVRGIEEVMQQRAPVVPNSIKLQQSQSSRKGLAANFFKATFSSRSKAQPAASSYTVEEPSKIGSAETKPVTRNRPRTAPTETKLKRRSTERPNLVLKPENSLDPARPLRQKSVTADPTPKTPDKNDLKPANVVLKIIKKTPAPQKPAPKIPDSILPPSLKPKDEKTKLSRTKYVNNNSVWTNANALRERRGILSLRGPAPGKESTLKGAPSVSSLDSKHHKVAPAREKTLKLFGSKEKLNKAHKKKDLGNNNAVLEDPELREGFEYDDAVRTDYGSAEELGRGPGDERGSQECISLPVNLNSEHMPGFQDVELRPRVASEASLTAGAREIESLRRELEETSMERVVLQNRVDELLEKASEADRLRAELERIKSQEAEREAALERLADENGALRARLRGVAHSPLSDSEKRQLLLAPAPRRMHSSAPASIALAHNGEGDNGESSTPEWDKHSSSSLSEVSVACLQDRILQMEEHHYRQISSYILINMPGTSEELQATLAELADLQSQLADAHADNERLADEKQVLLESLCRQTEKLEDSRTKVDTLQELLLREGIEPETLGPIDTDQQLFAVLKVSQEERRLLLSKQEQLEAELSESKSALDEKTKEIEALNERIRALEGTLERTEAEKTQWEHEAGAAREVAAARQHQVTTLNELLDAAKAKLAGAAEGAAQAEAAATAAARREAEAASARAHALAERLAHAQRQLDRAHSDARKLHDDALVSRNNAKTTISELEFQLEQLRQEKAALQGELQTLQENTSELQIQVQVATDEKLALMSRAGEALARAADLERQLQDARAKNTQLARERERDEAEWKQFQSDLLMTVRVANDFKTEAQRELERLVSENKVARDRIRLLEDQMHSLKGIDNSEICGFEQESDDRNDSDYVETPNGSTVDIFQNIRTRYLSRVHSVTESKESIVDQAFFKLKTAPNANEDIGDGNKISIEDVTLDETNDDDLLDRTPTKESIDKPFLPLPSNKKLQRQDSFDIPSGKLARQNALMISDDTDSQFLSRGDYNEHSLQKRQFGGTSHNLFRGKPKSYSLDNLNSNTEFKDVLSEATSIEFCNIPCISNVSLSSEGSDSVFLSPIIKSNYMAYDIYKHKPPLTLQTFKPKENVSNFDVEPQYEKHVVPIIKAESILPNVYPTVSESPLSLTRDDLLQDDLRKVNEDLKTTFQAAITRISEQNLNNDQHFCSEQDLQMATKEVNAQCCHAYLDRKIEGSPPKPERRKNYLKKTNQDNAIDVTPGNNKQLFNDTVDSNTNPFIEYANDQNLSNNTNPAIEDNVSYRLRINTDLPPPVPCKTTSQTSKRITEVSNLPKLKTVITPITILNKSDPQTSPVILSPVLVKPVYFKQYYAISQEDHDDKPKKTTVYYDDTDRVLNEESKTVKRVTNEKKMDATTFNTPEILDNDSKKQSLYLKNTKPKLLHFLTKRTDSVEQERSTMSGVEGHNVAKLSTSPQWLIDNKYYQPMENVPFVINTSQTFVKSPPITQFHESLSSLRKNTLQKKEESENYYEEIGEPICLHANKNIADDDKITNKTLNDEFELLKREEILKVPRKPKKPKTHPSKAMSPSEDTTDIVKEMSQITKSVISLSRSPSANSLKKPSGIGQIIQSLEKKPKGEARKSPLSIRKFSLQHQTGPSLTTSTSSLPRDKKYHWTTLEHKRLSHPIRSLNDTTHPLPLPPRSEETPPPPPLLSSASLQDIMATAASHRRTKGVNRQDSRLSVKSLIESIENAAKAAKQSPATTPVTEWPQVQATTGVTATANNIKNGMSDPPSTNGLQAPSFINKPPAPRSNRPSPIPAACRHEAS
ncbi:unnamed protein product [Leptosia nina]|uniref:Uncharacterized protein n=1 Tax=Leptosia nina TaxID=320188 RepID=A0AAV1IXC1_9NEOP